MIAAVREITPLGNSRNSDVTVYVNIIMRKCLQYC